MSKREKCPLGQFMNMSQVEQKQWLEDNKRTIFKHPVAYCLIEGSLFGIITSVFGIKGAIPTVIVWLIIDSILGIQSIEWTRNKRYYKKKYTIKSTDNCFYRIATENETILETTDETLANKQYRKTKREIRKTDNFVYLVIVKIDKDGNEIYKYIK